MRTVIKGKSYDTSTAAELGAWTNVDDVESWDFDGLTETLYRKRTGEYFLHGEGGPRTWCSRARYGGGSVGGERIRPLGYAEAREWAERCLSADEYEATFGAASEGDDVIATSVSSEAKRRLEQIASERGITQREALERCIAYFEE